MKKYLFYKTKIEGLQDVAETLRVIEKSAGAHIHFLRKKAGVLSEYKKEIHSVLSRLVCFYWDENHPLLKERETGKNGLLVLTGERGIVGGLYHRLVNEVLNQKDRYDQIWVIGKKGRDYLKEENIQTEELFTDLFFQDFPSFNQINEINTVLLEKFQTGAFKKISILYPKFLSLTQQVPVMIQFLPVDFTSPEIKVGDGLPIFEPSKKLIFEELIKKYIGVFLTEIIFEAKLSEFSARTVTAEHAVKETEELIDSLKRNFLKEKHWEISRKQIESFTAHQIL